MERQEDSPKKGKRKKKSADDAPEKEHKKNWRETYASKEEIGNFLNEVIILRQNCITGRAEFRVPDRDLFDAPAVWYPTGSSPLDEWRTATGWQTVNDRLVNSLCNMLSMQKDVRTRDVWDVINSDFVPLHNPFTSYLNSLPPWDGENNAILDLSMTVTVKGPPEEQLLFYICLRKWLVAMIAGWLDEKVVNEEILVFVGRQGIYKTTWFERLLPQELRPYFHSNANFGKMNTDEILKLSMYGLICCEELDTMTPSEMNRLKWAVTTKETNERKAYAHSPERRLHIASYCGTGNNLQFIDDDTGTRRWLPFEVESIRSPREFPFDHKAIFSQAYALYQQGFQYWFDNRQSELIHRRNERYEVAKVERELIGKYYHLPSESVKGEFVSSADILQNIGGALTQRLTLNKLGRAMSSLGFERQRKQGKWGYIVVSYTTDEIKANRSILAYDTEPDQKVDFGDLFDHDAGNAGLF